MNTQTDQLATLSLHDLANILTRRRAWIITTVLIFVAFGFIYTKTATPIYQASSMVMLENQEKNLKIESVVKDDKGATDDTLVPSEMQVLTSRNLMGAVLDKLGLIEKPNLLFNPPGPMKRLKGLFSKQEARKLTPLARTQLRDALIDTALSQLTVKQMDRSRAIEIDYRARDPQLATDMVNVLAQLYLQQQSSHRYEAVGIANSWLSDRVEGLRTKVQADEEAEVAYRTKFGLVDNKGIDLVQSNISDLSQKLIAARAELASDDARLSEITNTKQLNTAPAVLASPLIQELRGREADSREALALLSKDLGPDHPKIIAARSQVREIQSKIDQEVAKIVDGIKRDDEVASLNVKSLEDEQNKLRTQYNTYLAANVKVEALEREATANRDLLETLNTRWKETQSQEDLRLQPADARILSTAAVPSSPVSPKTKLILAVSLIAGLALGSGLAVAVDQFQTGIYNGKQLQTIAHVSNIALVPKVSGGSSGNLADYPTKLPKSAYVESLRSISAFLRMKATDRGTAQIINFTSTAAGEGKSVLVAGVARQLGLEGARVLVIDGDLRQHALTILLGQLRQTGLGDVLEGHKTFAESIRLDASGCAVLGAGSMDDTHLIGRRADEWQTMLATAQKQFDIILLDGPPILNNADSRLFARSGDNILCVQWKRTPLKQLHFALDTLHRLDCQVAATVITMVEGGNETTRDSSRSLS